MVGGEGGEVNIKKRSEREEQQTLTPDYCTKHD